MIEQTNSIEPGDFCRFLLRTLDAADAQTKRRKRDQTPDRIGLAIRRGLLEEAAQDAPPASEFERWLMEQVLSSPSPGAVRAMGLQIMEEYRFASSQPEFREWLLAGAPSADLDDPSRVKSDHEVMASDQRSGHDFHSEDHWCPICTSEFVRNG